MKRVSTGRPAKPNSFHSRVPGGNCQASGSLASIAAPGAGFYIQQIVVDLPEPLAPEHAPRRDPCPPGRDPTAAQIAAVTGPG